jgi:hypothetical protein
MGVLGAYSNHDTQERLRRLAEKLDCLAASGASPSPTTRRDRRLRSGLVPEAIVRVLGEAGEPMRVRDVHAVVEQLLGQPVSPSAVKTWLARHAVGDRATVMRLGRGRYMPLRCS